MLRQFVDKLPSKRLKLLSYKHTSVTDCSCVYGDIYIRPFSVSALSSSAEVLNKHDPVKNAEEFHLSLFHLFLQIHSFFFIPKLFQSCISHLILNTSKLSTNFILFKGTVS